MPHDAWTLNEPGGYAALDLRPAINHGVHLEQFFGLWAIEETAGLSMFDRVGQMDLAAHITAHRHDAVAAVSSSRQGDGLIGVLDINGTMTKRGSSLSEAGSTIRMRQELRSLANNPDVSAIVLRIDSPGGTVHGTSDMADEVAAAKAKKPVVAFVEDLCASAAYWVASQATEIVANANTAYVGSIGTFLALYDMSAAAEKEGIKPVVIRSGEFKGAGFPGTEITDEQKAAWQAVVDKTQAEFTAGVAKGRGMKKSEVTKLADGRVHLAQDALTLGLIDRVESFDAVLARLSRSAGSSREKRKMSEEIIAQAEPLKPGPATLADMKAGCPGANNDFLVSQLEANATLQQAQSAWMAEQNRRLQAAEKAHQEAEQARLEADERAEAAAKRRGVEGVGSDATTIAEGGSATEQFQQHVQTLVDSGMARHEAHKRVCRKHPDLRQAMVDEANAGRRARS